MKQDTKGLLIVGVSLLLVGGVCAALTATVFGPITQHGPQTNIGWLTLMVTMGCLPMGCFLSLLGAAKWLKDVREPR